MSTFSKTVLVTSLLLCFGASASAAEQFWGNIQVDGKPFEDPAEDTVDLNLPEKNFSMSGKHPEAPIVAYS